MSEIQGPVRVRAFEFLQDSGGAGLHRGGMSFRREYEMKEEEGTLQIRNDRCTFQPFGLFGAGRNLLNPGRGNEEPMPGKVTRMIHKGDVFRYEQAGGGGWGDPLKREPACVLADVRNEYVSVRSARELYGVAIDTRTWSVDEQETRELRDRIQRSPGQASQVDRGTLPAGLEVEAAKNP
jgi:N-methylhydantoinase B